MKSPLLFLSIALMCYMTACDFLIQKEDPKKTSAQLLEIVGSIENVQILPCGSIVKGKLDTGALTSSLAVKKVKEFTKGGERWVRFVYQPNGVTTPVSMECPIVYIASIKTHVGEPLRRPVVKMIFRIGNKEIETDVNLTSRENYQYSLLLGRKFLKEAQLAVASDRMLTYKSSFYKKHPSVRMGKEVPYSITRTDSIIKIIDIEERAQ